MLFDLNEEQLAFQASLRRALAGLPVAADRMVAGTAEESLPRFAEAARMLAELGVPAILVPEEAGGLGLGHVEAVVAAMVFGAAAPGLPGSEWIAASAVLAAAGGAELGPVLVGEAVATCVVSGRLTQRDGRLAGIVVAPYAAQCRWLAVPLGETEAVLVDLAAPGINLAPQPSLDLGHRFDRITVDCPAKDHPVVPIALAAKLRLLAAAEIAGAARHCLDLSTAYIGVREQFGRVIATNQALRHIAASDLLRCDTMALGCRYAAWALDVGEADAGDWLRAARVQAATQGPVVAENAVQLHGGIGFTWEYGLHLPLRRVARLASQFGSPGADQEVLARSVLTLAGLSGNVGHPMRGRN